MKICTNCGRECSDDTKICPKCGWGIGNVKTQKEIQEEEFNNLPPKKRMKILKNEAQEKKRVSEVQKNKIVGRYARYGFALSWVLAIIPALIIGLMCYEPCTTERDSFIKGWVVGTISAIIISLIVVLIVVENVKVYW